MLKKLLLFIILFVATFVQSQTLYWVGGSGYWNDKSHWSYTSGGFPSGVVPGESSNVIFDNASAVSDFTIQTLYSFEVNSIVSQNTQFHISVVGSLGANLKLNGTADLNENFYLKLNGSISLTPQTNTKYNFSHNNFTNDIFINSNSIMELGVFSTTKSITISGNVTLKNAIIFSKDLTISNSSLKLIHNTIQISNQINIANSKISNPTSEKSTIICNKNSLQSGVLAIFENTSYLKVAPLMPQACVVTIISVNNPSCFGNCNGTASFNLSGCTNAPYQIDWLNPELSASCQTLPPSQTGYAGSTYSVNTLCGCSTQYAIVFENSLGQQVALNITMSNPAATLLTFSQTQPTCNGLCNGQIRVNVVSGVTPLSINWNPPNVNHPGIITRDTLKNACAGTYIITASDFNGCITTYTNTLSQPAVLLHNGSSTNITCNSTCNGSAAIAPTGGTSPYTYVWNPAAPSPTVTSKLGLCAGVVSSTVTDSRGCTATYSTAITQPPAITLTVTKTDVTCGSTCNGTASITVSGGSGSGYTYTWTPSGSGSSSAALCGGNYTVGVSDNLNCTRTITFQIVTPPTLTATPTQTNITCNTLCNGAVNLNPTGGTPAYSYTWSPAISSGSTATNVCVGVYSYTLGDAQSCTYSNTISITQPPAITLTVSKTDVSCNGSCDGSISSNMSGGTSPYTYTWSPGSPLGQGTSTITSLCPASYSLNATDINGCASSSSISISQPSIINLNITSNPPACNGICNGSINSSPSGGTGPYTYTLQSSIGVPLTASPPYTNLCAASYTLNVRDLSGCVQSQTISLIQPTAVSLSVTATPISCFGQCTSTISTAVSGGSPAYTYSWSNGSTSSSLVNQCMGVYTATVTDGGGCNAIASVNVTTPTDMTVTVTPVNPNCNALCTGAATVNVIGGTPGYTINWSNSTVGNIASSLCQGVYTSTVTDLAGCQKIQTATIITPPAITLTATNGSVTCASTCDGSVSVVPTGGVSPYTISWNSTPVQTTPIASGLCGGNYIASITDNNGCAASTTVNVSQPAALNSVISNVIPSCNICIGSATANGVGGTGPYTYSWTPSNQTTSIANNLCAGIETVVVTDSKGCTSTQTVQITQTIILLVTSSGGTLNCNGSCNGIASVNAAGGLTPYTYTWSPVPIQNTQTATGLCAGVHTVTVADFNGCSNNATVTFIDPPPITLTVSKTDVSCSGFCDGVASASASGGTGPITYLWQPGGFTTSSISGLCPGDYTVTVSDANSCSQTQVVSITPLIVLTANFTSTNPSACTSADGSISFVPGGGVGPYTFTWTPGGSVNPLTNLNDGIYVLYLVDGNGCSLSFTTTLSDPSGPTVSVTSNSISCFNQCTGSASLSISGSGPFSINWPTVPSTNTVITNMCAGTYVAQVTDANSCVTNQAVTFIQPTLISSVGVTSNLACNAVCSASINLFPTGGSPPYTYAWTPAGGAVEDPVNLCAGTYSVDIRDVNNCVVTNTFVLTQPSALALSFNKRDVLCNAACNGAVRAILSGGTAPYTYTWTPLGTFAGSNLDTIVNLCTGVYSITASDFVGCSISGTINISEPSVLTSNLTSSTIKCNGQCTGSASINPSGGTIPYTYSYNTTPVSNTQSVGALCAGTYTGTVTDANGCLSINGFTITQPTAMVIAITNVTDPTCNAACNGSVSTTVSGGNPSYHYNWLPNGGPVPNPIGLCAGNYTFVVTDDSLCTSQALVTLTDPAVLNSNTSFTNPICNGSCNGIVTSNPTGGTSPYTYSWANPVSTNQTVNNLCSGTYTLTLTDSKLCQDIQTVTLIDPSLISVSPSVGFATCGVSNGSITVVAVNGTPPYTYNWLPPVSLAQSTSSVVTGIAAGVYTVIVTDANLCSSTILVPLSNSNGPTGATITFTDVTCNGQCNGSADISNPVGGIAPFVLSWISPASTNTLVTGLCAGTYTAEIEDANNCLFFQAVSISEPPAINDHANISAALCFGNCTGSIDVNPTGGTGPYTYNWSNSATTQTITALCPGAYSITITDSQNCAVTANYIMPALTTITSSTFATNNACFSDCNGTLLATNIMGGPAPYTFNWSDPLGQSSALALGLCNGNYSVTVTASNGCYGIIPAAIISPSQVTFTSNITQPSCGLCDGAAIISPTGGTPAYTILWSNNQTGTSVSNLCAGVYDVEITDGNGCLSNSNVIINNSSTITGEIITTANESCVASCDGSVTITAIGGVAPITYHWINYSAPSQSLTGICSGTYFCNMIDANGCVRTASVVIGAATTLSISSQVTQSSCSANTGSITVNVTGGTGSYTYTWSPGGASTPTLTNLAPGSYVLSVTDGNGCSLTKIYSVGSMNGPSLTYTQSNIGCTSACDGDIALTVSGGTPGYTILWSNSASTSTVNNLCSGNYSVIVTDAMGCKAVQNFVFTDPSNIAFNIPNSKNPICHNDCNGSLTAIPINGNLPYTYNWLPTGASVSTATNLCAGSYSINVTDSKGCLASDTYTLNNPTLITVSSIITNASCNNVADGAIDMTVVGGNPTYTYSWNTGPVTQDISSLLPGTYSVSIIDNGGCQKDTMFNVVPLIVIDAMAGNDTTFCQNGSFLLNGSASTGGIAYQWIALPLNTVVSNTNTASVIPATGTSTYVIEAINGLCTDRDTVVITVNALPNVDAGPFLNIPLFTSGQIGGSPTGPSGSLFTWSPSTTLNDPTLGNPTTSNTVTTIYTVTVVDGNGCINSDTVTVFIYPELKITNGFSPNADGKNDTWQIDLIQLFPDCEVEIYNRWGEQLFYSKGYTTPWNGQYKGKDLPVGTYYYIIKINNPAYPDAFTGPLTIFR